MNDIYYLSDNGRKVYLDRHPYWMQTGDFLDYEWKYTVKDNRICGFEKKVAEKEFKITVFGNTDEEYGDNWNALHEIFERDIQGLTPGRLYFGEYYLSCYVFMSEKTGWEYGCNFTDEYLRFVTDHDFWIKETTFSFAIQEATDLSDDAKAYPYTYPYIYPVIAKEQYLYNDHYDYADFRMVIHGPKSQANIQIGGHTYQVAHTIEESEYMVIDSRDSAKEGERVYLVRQNGEKVNLFDYRNPNTSIFEKIPPGNLRVDTNDTNVDITLYQGRSEPKWS